MLREEKKRSVRENLDKQRHIQRKAALREKGVSTQNAELLPRYPREATPTPILRDLEKHQEAQKALQQKQLRKKAWKFSKVPGCFSKKGHVISALSYG